MRDVRKVQDDQDDTERQRCAMERQRDEWREIAEHNATALTKEERMSKDLRDALDETKVRLAAIEAERDEAKADHMLMRNRHDGALFARAAARTEVERLKALVCKRCGGCVHACTTPKTIRDTEDEAAEQVIAFFEFRSRLSSSMQIHNWNDPIIADARTGAWRKKGTET